jgi:threonine/homoserine/homoserine lactone efflux protein
VDGLVSVLLLSFFGVSALVIVTPGQDTALVIRNSLRGGRRGGVLTAAGVSTGNFAWAIATSAGLAALLVTSEPAFHALRWGGAAYLVYLGLHSLYRAARSVSPDRAVSRARPRPYREGLLSNLGNPKIAVFFSSLLPQFAHSFAGLLALGFLFAAMGLAWLSFYAVAVERLGDFLRRSGVRRALDVVVGAVLVAFGARLAAER